MEVILGSLLFFFSNTYYFVEELARRKQVAC
jgi:hypothetical protein